MAMLTFSGQLGHHVAFQIPWEEPEHLNSSLVANNCTGKVSGRKRITYTQLLIEVLPALWSLAGMPPL